MSAKVLLVFSVAITLLATACAQRTIYVSDGKVIPQYLALQAFARRRAALAANGQATEKPAEVSTGAKKETAGGTQAAKSVRAESAKGKAAEATPRAGAAAAAEKKPAADKQPSRPSEKPDASKATPGDEATGEIPRLQPPLTINPQKQAFRMINGQPEYIVGIGDLLVVRLFSRGTQQDIPLLVPPSGRVSLSFLQDIQVAGLTASEIDANLTRGLARFLRNPQLDVFVKEYNSKRVFLFGEINRISGTRSGPGIYPLTGRITLLELMLEAGSETPDADLKNVEITRDGKVFTLNLEEALFGRVAEQNPVLQANDRIVIPNKRRFVSTKRKDIKVSVFGEVKLAGTKSFPADQTFRILNAIGAARGFTQSANLRAIRHIRSSPSGKIKIRKLNYFDILNGDSSQNLALRDGDQVFVDRTFTAKFSTVLSRVNPILSLVLIPATLRDLYTTGGGLRFNTDLPPGTSTSQGGVTSELQLQRLPIRP